MSTAPASPGPHVVPATQVQLGTVETAYVDHLVAESLARRAWAREGQCIYKALGVAPPKFATADGLVDRGPLPDPGIQSVREVPEASAALTEFRKERLRVAAAERTPCANAMRTAITVCVGTWLSSSANKGNAVRRLRARVHACFSSGR